MSKRPKFCLPAPHSRDLRGRARDLYQSGKTYQEIAEITKLPLSTLRNWCKRDGWKLAKPDQVDLTVATVPDEPVEVPESLSLRERQEFFQEKMTAAAVRLAEHVSKLDGEQLVKSADKLLKATQNARTSLKLDKQTGNPIIQIGVLCQPLPSMVRPSKQLPDAES